MATHELASARTVEAGSSVTKFRFVVEAADGAFDHVGTSGSIAPDGIAGDDAASGEQFPMIVPNGSKAQVEAGAATTRGALCMSDNVGRAIDFVDAAGNIACGRFRQAAGAAAEIVEIEFVHKKTGAGS